MIILILASTLEDTESSEKKASNDSAATRSETYTTPVRLWIVDTEISSNRRNDELLLLQTVDDFCLIVI